jgi:hypothetical protein
VAVKTDVSRAVSVLIIRELISSALKLMTSREAFTELLDKLNNHQLLKQDSVSQTHLYVATSG